MRFGLVVLFMLGCAPAGRVEAPHGPPPHDTPAKVEPVRWRLHGTPTIPLFISRLPDGSAGTQRFSLGGDRAEKTNGRITLAKQSLPYWILRSCQSGTGFIHFTGDSRVYWSNAYLADAVPVGTMKGDLVTFGLDECGPVAIRNPDGKNHARELWDEHGVHILAGTEGMDFLYFRNRNEGRAIRVPDQLFFTTDGGQSFVAATDQPYPKTPGAWLGSNPYPNAYVDGATKTELTAAWLHRAMRSEVSAMIDGIRLSDGTWVRTLPSDDRQHDLVSLRQPDGSVIDRQLPKDCKQIPFKNRLFAHCAFQNPAFRSLYPEQRALAGPKERLSLFVDAEAGVLIAQRERCRSGGAIGKCPLMRFDGTRWQEWFAIDGTLRAVRNGRMLVCHEACVIRSATDPLGPSLDLGEYGGLYYEEVVLLDDEVIILSNWPRVHGKRSLIHLALTARGPTVTRVYEAPNRISKLAFADAEHGVAESQFEEPMYTLDGGKSWLYKDSVTSNNGKNTCWKEGCAFGGYLVLSRTPYREPITFDGHNAKDESPGKSTSGTTLEAEAAKHPNSSSELKPPTATPRSLFPWYDCLAQRPLKELTNSTAVTGGTITHAPGTQALGWHGTDESGAFEVQTSFILPESKAAEGTYYWMGQPYRTDFQIPPLVTRHYAVLTTTDSKQSSLVVLREDGTTETLASGESMRSISVRLPDGRGLVSVSPDTGVFLLDPHGALLTHRWLLAGFDREERSPAVGPQGLGMVLLGNGPSQFYSLVAGSQPQPLPTLTNSTTMSMLKPCAKPRDPAATFVYASLPFVAFRVSSTPKADSVGASPALELFEVGTAQTCLRSATTYTSVPATLTAERGVLRGTAMDAKGSTPVTCRQHMREW